MATLKSNKAALSGYMQAHGNTVTIVDSLLVPAATASADVLILARIPAGTLVTSVTVDNPDLDTATNVAHKLGYVGVVAGSITDDDDYFGTGLTYLRGIARTTHQFAPIRFDVDVYLVATLSGGPTTTAGTVSAIVQGLTEGVK